MGVYKKAVITNAGRALLARSIAGEIVMQFSRAVTSSHIYPSDTDFKGYTSLEGIQQTVIPSNVQVVNDTLISVRGLFGNESISESYLIQNIGLYVTDGNEEVLFSVSQAGTPDEMPAYNGVAPSSFIYTIQATVSQANSLSLTINPAGTATTQDILDLNGAKLEIDGDVSETVVETLETVEDKFPIPSAGDKIKSFLGKVLTFLRNIKPLEADVTYYVATTGSDTTGDGTSAKPFKTPQHAVDILPKDLGGHIATIVIANGIYDGDIYVSAFTCGTLVLQSNTPNTVSSNVQITRFVGYTCQCQIEIKGIEFTYGSDNGAIYLANCIDTILRYTKVVTSANYIGIYARSGCMLRILDSMISNRYMAVSFVDSIGYVSTCSGSGNTYGIQVSGCGICKTISSQPSSINGNTYTYGGTLINENGTQISNIISSGLSCAWGTISGGYVRHGNVSGVSMVTILVQIKVNAALNSGQTYTVSGFPILSGVSNIGVASNMGPKLYSWFNNDSIGLIPAVNISSNDLIQFNVTYLTNS